VAASPRNRAIRTALAYNVSVAHFSDLAVAAKVIDVLQRRPSQDQGQLVLELGLGWDELEPSVEALIDDGYVAHWQIDGDRVYALAKSPTSRSIAELVSG
jgi:hypothetical protein